MKIHSKGFLALLQLLLVSRTYATTLYVDLNSASPTPPYATWHTAATNIQEAIDVATPGDLVLVTNGVYATGGKVMFGDLTNRVALDKAITVQSVNGPYFTTIRGNGATNGPAAVRCAWLTNGATLQGFTLTAGATRGSGDPTNTLAGGGALCLSTNALLQNCLVISNLAQGIGGGVFQGAVANSAILGNRSSGQGSGAAYATLLNCTVVSNWQGFATFQSRHTNTIIYYNNSGNFTGGNLSYSCSPSAPGGGGNITTAPLLYADGIHLQASSPCRGAGTNLLMGTDIDGQSWKTQPPIGCDEWGDAPVIVMQPQLQLTNNPIGFKMSTLASGQEPLTYRWFHNDVLLPNDNHFNSANGTNLIALGVGEADAGNYFMVVSNSFGVVTSSVAQLVFRFVNVSNAVPTAPFTSWGTAATNIQDAIDAANFGEVVLVADGIYRFGGKVMGVSLTNRVAINKALVVQSINGSEATIIEGNWNPTVTNGPLAMRCAWLTNGAALNGFTLRGGATRPASPSSNQDMFGGGVWGSSTNAVVINSAILSNTAGNQGGGAYQVSLVNCNLVGNRAIGSGTPGAGIAGAGQGGGAAVSHLRNCIVRGNYADQTSGGGASDSALINCALVENSSYLNGGAAFGGRLINCTVTRNTSAGYSVGAAVSSALATNSIIWGNYSRLTTANANYTGSTLAYCVSLPLAAGVGNLSLAPQLIGDGVHVMETSPARAVGVSVATGMDIDGEAWSNPPSIGCDEWTTVPRIVVSPTNTLTYVSRRMTWGVPVAGQSPHTIHWFKDGQLISDDDQHSLTGTVGMVINKFGPEHAGQYYVVASNAFGVTTSKVASVAIHCVDATSVNPVPPYTSWATAANTLQDAVDAAQAGAIILVTNGLYNIGGRIDSNGLTNRVIIDESITVMSVNGYKSTIIEGRLDVATNGTSAVRCVTLNNGSVLAGFTVRNGATLDSGSFDSARSGGGIWTLTTTGARVFNCLITNNYASYGGGGVYNASTFNSVLAGNRSGMAGGGAYNAKMYNCTVIGNSCNSFGGAGVFAGTIYNSIITENYLANWNLSNWGSVQMTNCLSDPIGSPAGVGNISGNPVIIDLDYHISASSICRHTGNAQFAYGEDMDGEPWANPPSIGADEVVEANLVGPISLGIVTQKTNTFVGSYHSMIFGSSITGRVSRIDWNFGDGVVVTNVGNTSPFHWWTNTGTFIVTCTAYNTDNPSGVSAGIEINVLPLVAPLIQAVSLDSAGFKFSFEAQESARYSVQYATNLAAPVTWNTLLSIFYSPGGTTQITDPAWTNSARFYRVLVQ